MRTSEFDYELPPELVAQTPAPERAQSRLLVLNRQTGEFAHRKFADLPKLLAPGDLLVLNNSRVIPARLRGVNAKTGGEFEMLLVEQNDINDWWVMLKPGRRARPGTEILLGRQGQEQSGVRATVTAINEEGHRRLKFSNTPNILETAEEIGEVPLPPYIARGDGEVRDEDRTRYQTVYAQDAGSVAAPTAGLHFTHELLKQLAGAGVEIQYLTLHVGLGTFAPVKSESLEGHKMHEELFNIPKGTSEAINAARAQGRRVFAVGTTTVRVLETSGARNRGATAPGPGRTRIFIHPPWEFGIVGGLITNFHLPRSTLLMLVSAFVTPGETRGRELLLGAYREAIRERYRFFSYGDAMLVL